MHIKEILTALLTILFTILFTSPALANIYKWTDANGNVSYASTPPPTNVKVRSSQKISLYKTPKSSLRRQSSYSSSINRNTTNKRYFKTTNRKINSCKIQTISLADRAHNQCQRAINKLPQVITETEKLLAMGRASGKLSDADYHQKKKKLRSIRVKPNTYSECIDNYKNNVAERSHINRFAYNNPKMILSMVIMEGAFREVAKGLRRRYPD